VAPSGVVAPYLVSTTETKVKLRWIQPANDGGCPITSFAVISDLGSASYGSDLETASVANKPHLFEHEFTFTVTQTSKSLGFKLKATNVMGTTTSESYLKVLVASAPPTPSLLISRVSTNSTFIELQMPEIVQIGGSTLTSYELLADNGLQSDFTIFYTGLERKHFVPVTSGRTYRFMFRV
jgi:hypothetical protein